MENSHKRIFWKYFLLLQWNDRKIRAALGVKRPENSHKETSSFASKMLRVGNSYGLTKEVVTIKKYWCLGIFSLENQLAWKNEYSVRNISLE